MSSVTKSISRSLSIIIPNYNGAGLIQQFFPSVLKAVLAYDGEVEIVFVDDCSTDDSLVEIERFRGQFEHLVVVKADSNGGFSRSCNLGIERATGEILFFLNTDVALEPSYFDHFSHHFEDPQVFAVTTCGLRASSGEQIDGIKTLSFQRGYLRVTCNLFDDQIEALCLAQPYQSFGVQGAYFFAVAEKVRQLGGFDERFSPFIFEETDLAYRALKRGYTIHYEPKCRGHHQVSSSLKSVARQQEIDVIAARNRLFFTWKNTHSRRLFSFHLLFLALRLLSFNSTTWLALRRALPYLAELRQARREEKIAAVVSDADLLRASQAYLHKPK